MDARPCAPGVVPARAGRTLTDRDAFLTRIRARLRDVEPSTVEIPGDWAVEVDDAVARFEVELIAAGGRFHRAPAGDAAGALTAILEPLPEPCVLVTREASVPAGVDEVVRAAGGEVLWWPEAGRAGAERADVGVTGALLGAAETGTVLLSSAPPAGRAPSLLPRVHVAFLERERVVPTIADLLARVAALPERPSNLVLSTGPSKTSDIENVLVQGVHGPAEAHVILIERDRA